MINRKIISNLCEINLTKEELLLRAIKTSKKQWIKHFPGEEPSFGPEEYAFLYKANLSNLDLSGLNMPKAYLFGADLSGTNFTRCNLIGATFRSAKVDKTDFTDADLSDANLDTLDLRTCIMFGADLFGAEYDEHLLPPDGRIKVKYLFEKK